MPTNPINLSRFGITLLAGIGGVQFKWDVTHNSLFRRYEHLFIGEPGDGCQN